MRFVNFWPLAFLSLIPIIIILYILKQKVEPKVISSTLLWKEVYKHKEASTPWEKLRKNILMFLQILTVLFLIFALTDPFLKIGGKQYKNIVIVIDNTGSMNAKYGDGTRFEEAQKQAEKYINSIKGDTNIAIITASNTTKMEISNCRDKSAAISKLKSLKPKDVAGNLDESLSLVKAMSKQEESYEALFITDKALDLGDVNGAVINLSQAGENGSIDLVAHKVDKDRLKVMVRVTNRGNESYSSDLNLYGEEELLDVKSLSLEPKESKSFYFNDLDFKGKVLKAELTQKDMLIEDNVAYDVVERMDKQKVLLVTEKNVFLEKALSVLTEAEVFKTNSVENINSEDVYNLYIFDGIMPEELPKQGNFIMINPLSNDLFKVGDILEGGIAEAKEDAATKYIENLKFGVKEFKDIKMPSWGKEFIKVGNKVAAFTGKKDSRNLAVIAFDFHKSDLILKSEFPVLMHNLVSELMNSGLLINNNFKSGDEVEINAMAHGSDIKVTLPWEGEENLPLRFPLKNFKNTEKTGVYKVSQKIDDKKVEESFAVNFPVEEESINFSDDENISGKAKENKVLKGGLNLKPYIIILAIIVLCIEWILYVKGY